MALDLDVVDPAEFDVCMAEPDGMPLARLEELLASLPAPLGAGFSGLVPSDATPLPSRASAMRSGCNRRNRRPV